VELTRRLPVACWLAFFLVCFDPGPARSGCARAGIRHAVGSWISVLGGEAGCAPEKRAPGRGETASAFGSWIRVSSAKYGSAAQWCSGLGWVARICNGRDSCTVTLPDVGTQWSNGGEHALLRRELICGPLSKARKLLYIGWYCSDGGTALDQPEVVVGVGGRATLSCAPR